MSAMTPDELRRRAGWPRPYRGGAAGDTDANAMLALARAKALRLSPAQAQALRDARPSGHGRRLRLSTRTPTARALVKAFAVEARGLTCTVYALTGLGEMMREALAPAKIGEVEL